jgi:hypothetical protein
VTKGDRHTRAVERKATSGVTVPKEGRQKKMSSMGNEMEDLHETHGN